MKRISYLSIIVLTATLFTSVAQAQWVQTNGPYGGDVLCITTLGNYIFIGTHGGVFESTDSGSSWKKHTNGLPNTYVCSITTRGSNLFAGTEGYGIYRSTDSGASWASASNGLPKAFTAPRLIASMNAIFIPAQISSYVSTDDGNDWTQLDTNLTEFSKPQTAICFDSATYFAGSWITKTTDNGKTWSVVATPQSNSSWDIVSLIRTGNIFYAAGPDFGVNRSTDSGKSWVSVASGLPDEFAAYLVSIGNIIYAANGDNQIFRSNDSGNTWTPSQTGLPAVDYLSSFASNNGILFAGFENNGIYHSLDSGATWMAGNLIEATMNTLASINDTIIAGAVTGLFTSIDNGITWQSKVNGMQNSNVSAILVDGENLFVGTAGGNDEPCLFESSDRGNTWNADTLIQASSIDALFRSDSNLLAGGIPLDFLIDATGVFLSMDDGIQWKTTNMPDNTVTDVTSFVQTNYALYATTGSGLYYSFTNGADWSPMYFYAASGSSYDKFGGASVLGQMGNMAWLAAKEPKPYKQCAIFYTDDIGNWQPLADTSVPAQGMVTAFASAGTNLFIATDSEGIFLTTDSGASWLDENLGLADFDVTSLTIHGDELLAGTATSGVWRRPLAEMIGSLRVASGNQTQDTISVYPDPASGIVNISCPGLTGTIKASLISETGATVWQRTITTNGQPFQLDLTGVANGAYRLELQAGGVSQMCKIVLER